MARPWVALALLVGAAVLCAVQAAPTLHDGLSGEKANLFLKIVECSGSTKGFKNPRARVTVMVPSDKAIRDFLQAMDLSQGALLANELLCDALLRYHVIPLTVTSSMINKRSTAQTLEPYSHLTLLRDGSNSLRVEDMHGNWGRILKTEVSAGQGLYYLVDKVLLSGQVFTNVATALRFHAKHHSALLEALSRANLLAKFSDEAKPFNGTLFAPVDKAMRGLRLSSSPGELMDLLRYHQLSSKLVFPTGVKKGKAVPTMLKGNDLYFLLGQTVMQSPFNAAVPVTQASVVPAAGRTVKVLKHNIWAGPAVIHGIDGVLDPKGEPEDAPAPPPPALRSPFADLFSLFAKRKLLQGQASSALTFRQQSSLQDGAAEINAAATGYSSAAAAAAGSSAQASSVGLFTGY